jgi:O-antigen/teichoic acid export membrane protein
VTPPTEPAGGDQGIRGSLQWAVALSWGERAITMIFTVILAAILGPEAFGIVAMALVYLAVVELLLEQGFLTTIIQREQLDRAHLDSAFWVNLAWCLVLAAASFALAGWWAGVNDVPQLEEVIQVLSILVVVSGLTIVQQAYLQRNLEFRKLAIRANVAALVGGVVGLALALSGAGVWSLVAQQLTTGCTSLLLLWAVSEWRPSFNFSRVHARDLLGFTSGVYLANVGGFVNRRSDTLLMGLFFGPTVVGIYRLADRFVDSVLELTMRPVGLVSLPHLSQLQRDPEALRRTVARFIRIAILTTLPAMLLLASCSDYVLAVVGPEWEIGSDALKLLCVVGIVKGLVHFTGPLLFAVARPFFRATMLWFLAGVSVLTVVVVGYVLSDASAQRQLAGMSGARAAVFLAIVVPLNLLIIWRVARLRPRSFLPYLPAPLAAGISAILAVEALTQAGALESVPPLLALGVAGVVAITVAGSIMVAFEPRARDLARRVVRMRRAPVAEP